MNINGYEVNCSPYAQGVLNSLVDEIIAAKKEWQANNPNASELDWKKYFQSQIEWKDINVS